ncbi:MAG: hypothetical protein H0X35_11180, partial [Pseudonocardiales bacterium]|nr:hypothetical protein [Pseudonocardiales bacterium]
PKVGGKHLRIESTVDAFGNTTSETDFGEDGVDDPIQSRTTWVQPEEFNGFIYRPETYQTSYTTKDGVSPVGPVRAVTYAWGGAGELRTTSAKLSGTLALDRSPLRGVPPLPLDASTQGDHDVVLEQAFYDAQGNILWTVGTNSRCAKTDYDTPFAELPVGSSVFVAGCDANPTVSPPSGGLTTARTFDRGFQKVTSAYSPAGRASAITYDGFARPLTVAGPSANSLFQVTFQPAKIEYRDSNDGGPSFVHVSTPNGPDESSLSVHESYDYTDPFGHPVVHLDQTGVGTWIASGYTERNSNGRVIRAYEPYAYSGPVREAFVFATPTVKSSSAIYDALGRTVTRTNLEGGVASSNVYRPFETDHYDAEQLAGGKHVGAYATTRVDGHGRVVAVTRHLTFPTVDTVTTSATFLATGEMTSRTETHTAGSDAVLRWMQYDSFGRMVLNVHPDTSVNFTGAVGTVGSPAPADLKAWRYAYNDSGEPVGTSDPRGCGKNVFYDKLGRVAAEDYWPCTDEQPEYSAPDLTTGNGTEYFARYDATGPTAGFLTSESDRARQTSFLYDSRGRVQGTSRQIARPTVSTPAEFALLASRYTPHVYSKTFAYDNANRLTTESTGADVDALMVGGQSALTSAYSARGTLDSITSSYGTLIDQLGYAPDGALTTQRLGDAAHTISSFGYDIQHRLKTVSIARPAGPWLAPSASYVLPAAAAPSTLEADLTEQTIEYDLVGNPTKITDATDPGPWPAGGKPITSRVFTYDDSYRLSTAAYTYGGPGGNDTFVSPYDAEVKAGSPTFPRLRAGEAHLQRVRSQSYTHDWLGNLKTSDDDQHLMGERSLGTIINGFGADAPHRFQVATSGVSGRISATYDASGNVLTWDQSPCLLAGSNTDCTLVSYAYTWDETNHLATAQRFETAAASSFTGFGDPGSGTLDMNGPQPTRAAINMY